SLLKMFVIAVLWRAAASTHAYFAGTTLGPFEQLAKQALLDEDPGDSDFFATIFARWQANTLPTSLERLNLSPYRDRLNGINTLRLYIGEFVAYVKVDKRRFDEAFSFFQLREQIPLVVVARPLESSGEFNTTNELLLRQMGLI